MSVLIRDNRIEIPALRDGAPTIGALDAKVMTGAGTYFTEVMDVGTFTEMIAFLLTASISGSSPTLDVRLQYSADGKNFIDSGDAFTQVTTTPGLTIKKITSNFGKYIRWRIDIGGTASPTYTTTLQIAVKS